MTDSPQEDLFNSLVTNNIETLEKLSQQIGKLDKIAAKLGPSEKPEMDWQKEISELESHLSNQLAIQFSHLTVQLEKNSEPHPKSTSPARSWSFMGKLTFMALFFINIGSLYYLSGRQAMSPEFVATYTFGQQMKNVWGKLNKQEKEKLVKLME